MVRNSKEKNKLMIISLSKCRNTVALVSQNLI
jgi:hypothetical protein